ncbi:MAG: hypothetical protein ACJAT4_002897 [Granulosicoccus sp.]|jgi:hypothetical protein
MSMFQQFTKEGAKISSAILQGVEAGNNHKN